MKKYLKPLVLVIIVSLIGLRIITSIMDKGSVETKENYISVEAEEVSKGEIFDYIIVTGTVSADRSVNIIPTIPAKVSNINVEVGDRVNKGDLLFSLDDSASSQLNLENASIAVSQAELGLKNAEQTAKNAEANYEIAKANYDMSYDKYQFAKDNLEKFRILYEEGAISETEYKQYELEASESTLILLDKQLEQAEQSKNQANNGIENAKLSLTQARSSYEQVYDNTYFEAPMDGYVTSINIVEDALASSSQPAMVIDSTDSVKIKVNVTENVINKLKKDSKAEVTISALGDKVIKGKISTLSSSSDPRTLLYEVTIELDNKDHEIKPGMFAEVKLQSEYKKDALYVNGEAVFYKGEDTFLYIIEDEKPVLKEVNIGIDNGEYIEITKGIKEKDVYIYKGVGFIDEDTNIKVVRGDE